MSNLWFVEFDKTDRRVQNRSSYKISEVLIIIFCSILCGFYTLEDIEIFAKERADFFERVFGIASIPSDSTMSRILSILDAKVVVREVVHLMKEIFKEHAHEIQEPGDDVIAVDGKTIRSTKKGGQVLHILTAYLTKNSTIIGQERIHAKTNEIPTFQEMLMYLSIKDRVITADAMHCQKKTCEIIIEKKGNYVIGLKKNQPRLYEDVQTYFESEIKEAPEEFEIHEEAEKGHGRITRRIGYKFKDIKWLDQRKDWKNLKSIFAIKRITEIKGTVSEEVSFYISSLNKPIKELMQYPREHWKVESMHWMLDNTYNEDRCYFKYENTHESCNAFKKLSLSLHKGFMQERGEKGTLKSSMLKCLLDENRLYEMLAFITDKYTA